MAPRKEKVEKTSNGGGGDAETLIVSYLSKFGLVWGKGTR